MQNFQGISEQFINSIKTIDEVPCYVKMNESEFFVIALHQHLGLVQGFTMVVNDFVKNSASIIIPDLFYNIPENKINEEDEFSCIKQMRFSDTVTILQKCIAFAASKNKTIILIGFSVGSALGLKLLEQFSDISLSFFFYGYPMTKTLAPEKVKNPVTIFHAIKNNIKYLSDQEQLKSLIQSYDNHLASFRVQRIDASHGFMNEDHENFDQKAFKYCQNTYFSTLSEFKKSPQKLLKDENVTKNGKKEEQGGCKIF